MTPRRVNRNDVVPGRSESAPPFFPPAQESRAPFGKAPIIFQGSFPNPTVRLTPALPELALLGRSNVGKSSLINALFGRPVARVSTTPGRTALINVFQLPEFYLIDLPGYGYARVSQKERARYGALLQGIVKDRATLTGVVWLLDIRHLPSKEDLAYAELLGERGLPVLAVLTKGDKLPQARRQRQARAITEALALEPEQVQLTSSSTGLGITDLGEAMLAATRTS
ncbi:MAG TPA: ribosome biogenesis GTP-binding protein YihA/YsxC [Gemmatimonadales bacterium]|nr:ribosome biogenesis GTP-binding protein YihA/YsxC [Gemmatimonadales bacterium]